MDSHVLSTVQNNMRLSACSQPQKQREKVENGGGVVAPGNSASLSSLATKINTIAELKSLCLKAVTKKPSAFTHAVQQWIREHTSQTFLDHLGLDSDLRPGSVKTGWK